MQQPTNALNKIKLMTRINLQLVSAPGCLLHEVFLKIKIIQLQRANVGIAWPYWNN
jgi:hypothetical protein